MKKYIFLFMLPLSFVSAQSYFPNNSGVKTTKNIYQAFTNATIHVSADLIIEDATLLEKDGIVISVGKNISIPKNTEKPNARPPLVTFVTR